MAGTLRVAAAAAIAAAALACTKPAAPPRAGLGRRIAEGPVAALRASPDGASVAWLTACAPVAQGLVPRGTRSCELRVAPTAGGEARTVAAGVSTLPHGFAWTPDGALLALARYDHGRSAGTLVLWERGGDARAVAEDVTFYAAAPGGRVGFVSRGALALLERGSPAPVPDATRVATFEFAPAAPAAAPIRLLARREAAAGGELLALGTAGVVRRVASGAGEYRFSSRGDFAFTLRDGDTERLAFARAGDEVAPAALRRNVRSFAFAPAGGAVAFLADMEPGRQGDLWVAVLPPAGPPSPPEKLADGVGEFRWATEALRIAWLAEFDPGTRSGSLAVGGPGAAPVQLAKKVSAYDLAPDGERVAFLEHVLQGGYSVDLKLAHVAAGAPPRVDDVARGVFGFEVAPGGELLYYRSGCTRNGESCDLFRIPTSGLGAGAQPERIAQAVKSFELDRRRPGRILLGWARTDREALDLGVWEQGKLTRVDENAVPGTAALVGPDASRLVYAVSAPGREGVYVADVK